MTKTTPQTRHTANEPTAGAEQAHGSKGSPRPRYRVQNIPEGLKAVPHWVVFEARPTATGKLSKMPYIPGTSTEAKCNDPSTWCSFEVALRDAEVSGRHLGLALTPELGLTVIDLDNVLGEGGALQAYAEHMVDSLDSYTEVSISGRGVHIFVKGRPPQHFTTRHIGGPVEVYPKTGARFILITGDTRPDVGSLDLEIAERTAELAQLFPASPFSANGKTTPYGHSPQGELTGDEVAAVVALVQPAWSEGQRHHMAVAVAGLLAKRGVSEDQALAIVGQLSGDDEQPRDREKAVRDTYAKYRTGGEVSGYAAIAEFMDPADLERLTATFDAFNHRIQPGATSGEWAERKQVGGVQGVGDINWPVLDPAALYGLSGEVVRIIDPHTEGDPVAVLVSFLTMFGSAVGPTVYAPVGATRHHANLFALSVGQTARGRKGTALREAERLVRLADPSWGMRVVGGLSSGEGLIQEVRDPTYTRNDQGDEVVDDPGALDKRLLIVEEEFSAVLSVAGRQSNTLSEVVRRAWDGRDLRVMTRKSPLHATEAHIALLGHITREELLRELDATDRVNGFANRFLFVCVRRSKLLPQGGQLSDHQVDTLAGRIKRGLEVARLQGEIRRDVEADAMWEAVYPALTEDRPGMLGAITARAEAQVLRLSLLYALLDGVPAIQRPHLEAALALWQYCENSARFIFGDAIGDPIADRLMAALRANGPTTQSGLSDLFGRNIPATRVSGALETLLGHNKVTMQRIETGGRPSTVWEAIR